MSHRIDIWRHVEERFRESERFPDVTFRHGKMFNDTAYPQVGFYQRFGGKVNDTTGAAFTEELLYAFEVYGINEEQVDNVAVEIEAVFDRAVLNPEGKKSIWMTRTAPTLVEEVGVGTRWRAIVTYSVHVNLVRRTGAGL